MPSMGLGLGLARSGGAMAGAATIPPNVLTWEGLILTWAGEPLTWTAVSLDFSALTALPSARQSAVTAAAETAAATLSVTPQSIIDALSVGRGLCSMLPNDGCLLASSGGAVTVQGDPVGAIRSWTGAELATQSNASLQPVSGADGVVADGTKRISLLGLVDGNLDAVAVLDASGISSGSGALWEVGMNGVAWVPFSDSKIYDSFGTSTRIVSANVVSGAFDKGIYQPSLESGLLTLRWNGSTVASQSGLTNSISSTGTLLGSTIGNRFYLGTVSAFALNTSNYSAAQRNAIREFCRNYYEVTY